MDIQTIQEAGNKARGTTHQFNAEVMEARISDLEAAVAQMYEIVDALSALEAQKLTSKATQKSSSRSSVGNLDAGHV
jgi:molybdopterin/thiamine biosynthesis adenylyltransferase